MDDKILLKQIEDNIRKALKKGSAATRFLTPEQLEEARRYLKFNKRIQEIDIIEEGGFIDAERKRLLLINGEWGGFEAEDWLAALVVRHRRQDQFGHRDLLGALMNLGIERDTVGDLEIEEEQAILVCTPEVMNHIKENLTRIGRHGVQVIEIPLASLGERKIELAERTITAASLRIDCLASEIFNLSRKDVAEAIQAGRLSLNHRQVLKPDDKAETGDRIILMGKGKARILEIEGLTKKERHRIRIGIYV